MNKRFMVFVIIFMLIMQFFLVLKNNRVVKEMKFLKEFIRIEICVRQMRERKRPYFYDKNKGDLYVKFKLKITAYNSEISQTDDSPQIGAWNNKVGEGTVAISRDLEMFGITNGTPIIINGKRYIVRDRMNKRKTKQIDIWMDSKDKALEHGIKEGNVFIKLAYLDIERVLENINNG